MTENNIRYRKRVIRRQYNLTNDDNNNNDDSSSSLNNEQQQQQQRMTYVRNKSGGLICSICDGPAHGYNFDTITCESCKAFFRRNALRNDKKFKCRAHNGQCVINVQTRKRCKACRLAKCFAKGMRADWILTDEERLSKRQKIEENRRLRRMLYPDSCDSVEDSSIQLKLEPIENDESGFCSLYLPTTLSFEDLAKIEQIKQAYSDSVRLTSLPPEIPSYPHTAQINISSDLMNLPTNLQTTRLITYFKLLPEFSMLTEHDKLVLIKYNAFTLVFIRSVLLYDPMTDNYHDQGTDDCGFSGKDLIQCFSLHQYEQTTRCICQLLDTSQNDQTIIQILLVVMLLSKGSAFCTYIEEPEPISEDISSIFRTQNIFIELLWKYCENKFGYKKTINTWLKLVMGSINAQLQGYNTRYHYVKKDVTAEELVPLMKSVVLNV